MLTSPVEMSERLLTDARQRPTKALAEAIWNALDVGADRVNVSFEFTLLEAIKTITVVDDGAGMNREQAMVGFREYGDSWKRRIDARTHNGRSVHGQRGQGRYDILHLGTTALWTSIAEQVDGTLGLIEVELQANDAKTYRISEPSPHDGPTGTTLKIANVTAAADGELNRPELPESLAADFALYLRQYPAVELRVRDVTVDPSSQHLPPVDIEVTVEGVEIPVIITFIEWKKRSKGTQRIYLCDANGAALLDIPADLRSRDIIFTAYVCWDGFKNQDTSAYLSILGGEDLGAKVFGAGRQAVDDYLVQRAQERRAQAIDEWKSEQSYPYTAEPTTTPEKVVRKTFDIVATASTPVLAKMDVEQRRFSMQLMKVAIETDPSAVQKVMREVLRLPEERIQEMASLFERTTLESVITASHSILNRLDFLAGLRTLIFDIDAKRATTERRQLHKILEREAWVFGDEWTLTASDERLRRVLVKHLRLLGEEVAYAEVMPDSQAAGKVLIPDLVLSGSVSSYSKSREYLVVELKRPSVTLGKEELDQLEAYAIGITEDEQFSQPHISWDFWLIGNAYGDYVDRKLKTPGNPHGCALIAPKFRVHVRSWAEVLGEAEHRHKYIEQALDAISDEDSGLTYLNRVHRDLIPDVVKHDAQRPT
jgi:Histidine kinase-, DNA gyrase B-, and HSP90-like ATPase